MHRIVLLASTCLLLACSDASSDAPAPGPAPAGSSTAASVEPPGCERSGELEPDFSAGPDLTTWSGPGVDPKTGALLPPEGGTYVVATTRLNLRADGAELFGKHVGAILGELASSPGFIASQTGISERCGVARTLTVWKDEESLYAFVTGKAHQAAINDTARMSRGLSNTTHFSASVQDISWQTAAKTIGADDGPFY